jgi:hypothetical protein
LIKYLMSVLIIYILGLSWSPVLPRCVCGGQAIIIGAVLHFLPELGALLSPRLRGTINKLLLEHHTATRDCNAVPNPDTWPESRFLIDLKSEKL